MVYSVTGMLESSGVRPFHRMEKIDCLSAPGFSVWIRSMVKPGVLLDRARCIVLAYVVLSGARA